MRNDKDYRHAVELEELRREVRSRDALIESLKEANRRLVAENRELRGSAQNDAEVDE